MPSIAFAHNRVTLTIVEAAQMLGVPEDTLRGWVRRAIVPSVRIGGRRLIRVSDLDRLVSTSSAPT